MSNINELFAETINKGLKAAEMIIEPKDKAIAYAELAKALAYKSNYSAVEGLAEGIAPIKEDKEAIKEVPKAEAKEEETFTEEPRKVPSIDDKQEEAVIDEDEWTEETLEAKKEQCEFIQQLREEYEVDALNQTINDFSQGQYTSIDELRPSIIDGYVAYLKDLINSSEDEEAANQ